MANSQPTETSKPITTQLPRRNSPTLSHSSSPPNNPLFSPLPPTSKFRQSPYPPSPPLSTSASSKEETLEMYLYTKCPLNIVQCGGYTLTLFIDNISDDLKCGICGSLARDSVQTLHCGGLFCKVCIDMAFACTRNNNNTIHSNSSNNKAVSPLRKTSYTLATTRQEELYSNDLKIDCPNTNCTKK